MHTGQSRETPQRDLRAGLPTSRTFTKMSLGIKGLVRRSNPIVAWATHRMMSQHRARLPRT